MLDKPLYLPKFRSLLFFIGYWLKSREYREITANAFICGFVLPIGIFSGGNHGEAGTIDHIRPERIYMTYRWSRRSIPRQILLVCRKITITFHLLQISIVKERLQLSYYR